MKIYCCKCEEKIIARKTNGIEIYPHREDLHHLIMWICDGCGNYVGSHKVNDHPVGYIAYPELREWRIKVHEKLDPLWQEGGWSRTQLYKFLTRELGWKYHTSCIRSVEEAQNVLAILWRLPGSYKEAMEVEKLFTL